MRFIIYIGLVYFLCSCSFFQRYEKEKYVKVNTIRNIVNGSTKFDSYHFLYFETRDDESCFESNPNNKETITVGEDNTEFALDYFYKRISKIDVTIRRVDSREPEIKSDVVETFPFVLEMAACFSYFKRSMSWYDDEPKIFVSFRLAD